MPTRDEILATALAEEVAEHGAVRPPWVRLPNVHPFDIAWRMGEGETHVMLWSAWSSGRDASEIVATIRRYGAVPADWAWWAAEASALLPGEADELYEIPFEEVRGELVRAGIAVDGEPATE
jgi:hypothetical protein